MQKRTDPYVLAIQITGMLSLLVMIVERLTRPNTDDLDYLVRNIEQTERKSV